MARNVFSAQPARVRAVLLASSLTALCFSGLNRGAVAQAPDATRAPYFRSFSSLSFDPEGDGGYAGEAPGGADYRDSNAGPASTSFNGGGFRNGAGVSGSASSLYNGFFSARNSASMTVTNIQNEGYYIIGGQGSHTRVQFFTPGALAERSVFTWRITGSANTNIGQTFGRLDFMAGLYDGVDYNELFFNSNAMTVYGAGTYTYTLPQLLNQPINLFYWSAAAVEVTRAEAAAALGQTMSGFANYGNTYELTRIELFDGDDNLIPEWTMVDLSTGLTVFDQDGRTAAAAAAVVPEQGTLSLTGMAILVGGIGVCLRRPRRRYLVAG